MQIKHWLKLYQPVIRFIILAISSLIITLIMAEILPASAGFQPPIIVTDNNYLETADSLTDRGLQQLEMGDAQTALNIWKQAELAYRKLNNDEGIIGSQLNQAQAMQALGQYLQAKELLSQTRKFIENKSNSELKVVVLRSLGDVLRLTGDLTKSEEVLNESLKLAQELPSAQNISEIQLSLGNTALAQAKRAKAVNDQKKQQAEIQKALNFYQLVVNGDGSSKTKLQAQLNQLKLFIADRKWSEAQNLWSQINAIVTNLPISNLSIEVRLNLAHSLLELKQNSDQNILDWQDIARILTTAFQQAKTLQNFRYESYTLGNLGTLYEAKGQNLEALEVTQKALNLAQSNQAWDIAYQWQWQLGRLYNNLGEKERAIAYYTTAVNTLDRVRQNLIAIDPEGQFSFRDDVEPVYRQLVDLLLQPEAGKNEPSQENLRKAIEQIDGLQLAEIENFLRCNLPQVVKVSQFIDKKAAIIYPIILEKRLAVILQLPGQSMKYHQTIIAQKDIEKTLENLRKYLSRSASETPEVIQEAQKLYELIIKPFEQVLATNQQINTLVFVLDGALRNIPMAVLYDRDRQKYLIEKDYAIAIAPQLQLFTPKPLERKLKVFVGGIGEPQTINSISFPPIEYLEAELKGIAQEINTNQPLLNTNFTKTNLQHQLELGDFSAVHLKTHGVFSSDPENTFIVGYNELIKGKDLANLIETRSQEKSKNIELLVLSACETAKGDNRAVLGLAGIAVRAGARSTLSTLWKAQDKPNTELMLQFYEELSKPGTSRTKALHIAQKALFERDQPPHIWANYILVGNWL